MGPHFDWIRRRPACADVMQTGCPLRLGYMAKGGTVQKRIDDAFTGWRLRSTVQSGILDRKIGESHSPALSRRRPGNLPRAVGCPVDAGGDRDDGHDRHAGKHARL